MPANPVQILGGVHVGPGQVAHLAGGNRMPPVDEALHRGHVAQERGSPLGPHQLVEGFPQALAARAGEAHDAQGLGLGAGQVFADGADPAAFELYLHVVLVVHLLAPHPEATGLRGRQKA